MATIELIKAVANLIGADQVTFKAGSAILERNGVAVEIASKETRGVRGTYSVQDLESVWSELKRLSEAKALLESLGYRVYRRGSDAD